MKSFFIFLFTLVFICTDSVAQVNLNSGLVGYYPFSGDANDASGNNHHGTLQNNIQLTTDRFGKMNSAFLFDGVDDYIAINDNMGDFSTPHFSLVLWFKTSSNNVQNLVGKRNFGPTNGQQYQFFINYPPFPGIGSNIISDQNVCGIGITSSTSYINSAKEICSDRWYSAVIVFDGLFHKIYINGVLMRSVATNFNAMAPCNSELRFGNWWQGDLIPFKGVMDDIRWYNRPLTDDEIAVLSENTTINTSADFIFQKEICSPQQVRFFNLSPLNTSIQWDFGDGNMSNSNSPVHFYPLNGSYPVTLITGNTVGCRDTIRKNVDLNIAFRNSILTADTTICQGDSVALRTDDQSADYCWNTSTTLSNYSNVYAKPTNRTTYIVKQDKSFQNLVVNGNFETGNTGFSSDYIFSNQQTADGQYGIVSGAKQWMPSVVCTNCSDHTTPGTGSMLISDGSNVSGKNIWCQQINVQPGKEYKIVFWTKLLTPNSRPSPELKINGNTLEGVSLLSPDDDWFPFTAIWNSGTNSTLDLCLGNGNISATGNVFALDDISVTESGYFYDSITIDVSTAAIVANNDTSICKNEAVQLNASGGTTYTWSPVSGLSDPTIANPIASPAITTRYSVRSLVNGSCIAKDSILVTINPLPSVLTNNETSACPGFPAQLTASGGVKYQWSPSQTLSDATLSNPFASPTVNTMYTVMVTDINGCTGDGEVKVSIAPTGKLYIPNAFTPNSDGVNDCFSIKGALGSSIFELAIYNRFGERVFYTNNPSNCWDGSFKGKPQPSGSFAYTLKTSGPCGAFTEKGTVTVIR